MAVKIQFRRGLASEWTSTNPILSDGELGLETDTGKFKVGDGSNEWSDLEYSSGTQGPQGEQGIQGIQGEQGEQGIQGEQGLKGDTGDQGIQGVQGEKGDKGDTGEQGIQGIQGIKGDTGDTGLQGIQGEKGDKGDTGDQGIQGIQGEQGEQGIQGEQGLKGDTGDQGIQGIQGEQGDPGEGVPAGGSAGQVLTKIDGTDYNTQWSTPESGDPWTVVKLASDFTISTTSNNNVTNFYFTPATNKTYLVMGYFLVRTATATVGARPGLAWPSNLTDGASQITVPNSNTALAFRSQGTKTTQNSAGTGLPTTTDSYLAELEALVITSGTTSGNVQITLASETAGTNVTMKAGSVLMYREL